MCIRDSYYGAEDADEVIIAMGSVCDTISETVDYLNANGRKVGLVKVRLYRPFSVKHLVAAIPSTVKKISVLDRTKEPGSIGEPLYLDVVAALRDTEFANVPVYTCLLYTLDVYKRQLLYRNQHNTPNHLLHRLPKNDTENFRDPYFQVRRQSHFFQKSKVHRVLHNSHMHADKMCIRDSIKNSIIISF